MGEPMKKTSCQVACWAIGAAAGFVAFVMLMALGGWGFIQAVFGGAVIFILLGGLLSWILCKPLPALGEIQAGMAEIDAADTKPAGHGATKAAPAAPASVAPAAPAADTAADSPATAAPASAVPSAAAVAAADPLTGDEAPSAVPPVSSAPAAPVTADAAQDADRPATLSAARGGTPDNLKEIKGIGPKLETMLHEMGFYHFDQIAAWTPGELAWVDQNLTGFKGRASRDNWVEQAKVLASGGETEFSKRVDDGDVY